MIVFNELLITEPLILNGRRLINNSYVRIGPHLNDVVLILGKVQTKNYRKEPKVVSRLSENRYFNFFTYLIMLGGQSKI